MVQVHRMFFHYSEFPLSRRVLYTCTLIMLGIGYLFAMVHIYNSHAGRDGKPGLSAEDIAIAYGGNKEATKLEAAMMGPMSQMLPTGERGTVVGWVRRGLDKKQYDEQIKPILEKRCIICHDGSNPHIPNLSTYDDVSKVAQIDTGATFSTLVRVSHIHLFGITFIFYIMGSIFSHAFLRPVWLKAAIIAIPFAAVAIDIGSWYVTKFYPGFAWVVIGSGGMMGLCFAAQWIISMYQIWIFKYPSARDADGATTV